MKTSVGEALILSIVMAAVIFFCRVFPFLFFKGKNVDTSANNAAANNAAANNTAADGVADSPGRKEAFLSFVERIVPPAAMTVLAFNSLAGTVQTNPREIIPAAGAAVFTAAVHLWRRNPLISIFGGTALFMVLQRLM